MMRMVPCAAVMISFALPAFGAEKVAKPVSKRFSADVQESPDFRSHVAPLLGRLGCNGRACHGSFQGRGGFRLSLFGHDFKLDHDGLTGGDEPRVDLKSPADSLMLQKPISDELGHGGGHRLDVDSWEYRLLLNWITAGAKPVPADHPALAALEVTPSEIVFQEKGDMAQLKVVVRWSDGSREDVTPLCRFRTNSGQVATIGTDGLVTANEPGDTHIVVFYDAGVLPIPVMRPVTDKVGPRYPNIPTPTRIDELVVEKLSKLGVVPSELADDAQFLRRVSLDLAGTLPTPTEVEAFLADASPGKRSKKIDELLETPAYAAWWTTRLCDITGNNDDNLNNVVPVRGRASRDWYDWIHKRVANNTPYDELVAGIVLAVSRDESESFEEYSKAMSDLYRPNSKGSFADREHMPYYWARRNFRRPEDRAIGFAYTFMGIRIQCAQCHKHPFDQWTKDDFKQFTGFFSRVNFSTNPAAREEYAAMQKKLGLAGKRGGQLRRELPKLLKQGETVPFQEVYAIAPRNSGNKKNRGNNTRAIKKLKQQAKQLQETIDQLKKAGDDKKAKANEKRLVALKKRIKNAGNQKQRRRGNQTAASAKLLGGDVINLDKHADARKPLMEWLSSPNNDYFARAFVNRVWANYFNVGIVEPPDDLSLANPPSNKPLLDYLTQGFIDNGFDMKWLHRQIAGSRTYQLSWTPNDTNRLDETNFSHAVPRRLPAEVAFDALQQATAADAKILAMHTDLDGRAIVIPGAGVRRNTTSYALRIFGRSVRETNCDCDRSSDASLLQTVFLRNDNEVLSLLDGRNRDGWLFQVEQSLPGKDKASRKGSSTAKKPANYDKQIAQLRKSIKQAKKADNTKLAARLKTRLAQFQKRFNKNTKPAKPAKTEQFAKIPTDAESLVRQAYLRTLSRYPSDEELGRSVSYIDGADEKLDGLRGLLWALINTKEFIVNH